MKKLVGAMCLAGASAFAGTGTMTAGSSLASGVWTGDKPAAGGSSETAVSLEAGGDWTVANDLGAEGWLTLNGLTWSGAGALTLTGDGFAFAGDGARVVSNGKLVVEGSVRLDVDTTFAPQQEVELAGDLAGDGKLTIDSETCANITLRGKRTGAGDTFIRRGGLHIYDQESLGTGKYWINESEYFDFKRLYLHGIPVVANEFELCDEGTVNGRLETLHVWENSGETHFTGKIVYRGSKVYVSNGNRTYFDNVFEAAQGNTFMVFTMAEGGDIYLTRANDFSDRLTLGLAGRLHLTVPGTTYRELWMYNGPTLVCDAENVLCANREMGCTGSGGKIELNGFSQATGGYSVWDARNGSPLKVMNSDHTKTPTFTMVQGGDNPSAQLTFEGPMNFVKAGAAKLLIASATSIDGDLTVREGKLKFAANAGQGTKLAKTVTVTGGVLDLGGQTWSCDKLVMTGGTLQNGVLICGETQIAGGVTCLAELAGNVTVAPTEKLRLPVRILSAATGEFALPEGTVVYYPFNGDAEEMLKDCGGGGYDLWPSSGTPVYSADGRNGGCLYVDGNTWLVAPIYPAVLPKGEEPYTVVCWVRADEGCSGAGGWVSYGGNGIPGGGNSFRFNGGDGVWNYWNNVDVGMEAPGIANREWHQVVGTWDGSIRRLYYDSLLCPQEDFLAVDADFILLRSHDGCRRGLGLSVLYEAACYGKMMRAYDAENRIAGYALTNAAGHAVSVAFAYDGSRATGTTWTVEGATSSSLTLALTCDAGRPGLVTRRAYAFDGSPVYWHETDYDLLGRPTDARDSRALTREWLYNRRSELASATYTPAVGTPTAYGYTYDTIGNRVAATENSTTLTYTANALNQYTNINRTIEQSEHSNNDLTYDDDGNLTNDGRFDYAYDDENRLVSVYPTTPVANDLAVENGYDHLHRRIRKVVYKYLNGEWVEHATHTFVWDGMNIVLERIVYADRTTRTCEYYWGPDRSGTEQGAGGVEGLLAVSVDGTFYFPLYGDNSNIVGYVSETGTLAAQYVYDPYGNIIETNGSQADLFAFGFSTKYHDRETGLVAYQRRFYNPTLGRWLNHDPMGELYSCNLFSFVDNAPVSHIDLWGLLKKGDRIAIDGQWLLLFKHRIGMIRVESFSPLEDRWPNHYRFGLSLYFKPEKSFCKICPANNLNWIQWVVSDTDNDPENLDRRPFPRLDNKDNPLPFYPKKDNDPLSAVRWTVDGEFRFSDTPTVRKRLNSPGETAVTFRTCLVCDRTGNSKESDDSIQVIEGALVQVFKCVDWTIIYSRRINENGTFEEHLDVK